MAREGKTAQRVPAAQEALTRQPVPRPDGDGPLPPSDDPMSYTYTTDLAAIRAVVHRYAIQAGLTEARAIDLTLAVSEVGTLGEHLMIYVHSIGRAVRYYPRQPALCLNESSLSFCQLHDRVKSLAAALTHAGFVPGDRLALLLPNGPEYIQFVYACSWLGIIVVPINTRLSVVEIDRVLADASPRGLIRHSTLPSPGNRVPFEIVLDQENLDGLNGPCPDPCYDPEAILAS